MGHTNTTIGKSGCFITALGMLAGITPPEVNTQITQKGGYSGASIVSDQAAKTLGLEFNGKTTAPQNTVCIAETNHYAPSYPQHFFVWLGDGNIIDSLNGQKKKNPYHIVSYRLFKPKQGGTNMSVRTELDKPGLAKAKQGFFVNNSDNGDDIQDYFNTLYGGKPLGDNNMMAFLDYMWKHQNRKKVMAEIDATRKENVSLKAQVKTLQDQLAHSGNVDKVAIKSHADAINGLVA